MCAGSLGSRLGIVAMYLLYRKLVLAIMSDDIQIILNALEDFGIIFFSINKAEIL